jgi:superfamily II DNA or RNA helicase
MAQRPPVVAPEATSIPEPADIARVATFAREPFVCEGEVAEDVLAPGTIRRHAFEFARAELDAGAEVPSQKWRRRWSLLLGLDRALHTEVPVLADGTTLNPHQVDALSGTYAALLADAQRRARGDGTSDGDALLLSFEDDEPTQLDEPPPRVTPADEDDDEPDDGPAEPGDEDEDDEEGSGRSSIEDELEELPDAEPENESALYDDEADEDVDEDIDAAAVEDPNAHKRFWFEHATGAGKTVAAMGFVEACRTGGVLILTHRRNLVDQFIDELQTRGYGERLSKPLLGDDDRADGPVTIETYQWFVRNAGQISGAYTVVICDEAHTALGEKTSATIRAWTGPIFIGMTATGALIARHVTDLFPTQTSRFDLAQAARRGVIAPLRSLRIPPGPGVRTIAKVPLRKGEVDMEFDQDELAKLLDQAPFNLAIADLYKTRFRNTPGVVYTAGVKHAYNVAESFRALDMKAEAVSGETPKRELAKILADYEAGDIDVLVNAQLLAEGWNSPRATICMHLAPTASKRIYQQRVGRVTRRHPGKEAGVVIDFVHPATGNDDPVVTLHSLLDRDVYRGGAIVVGPVRRGRGRRVKVERRVLPVTPDIERRRQVFERELWRIAVEQLDWGEQRVWAALAGAKASPANWRRGRAMLNFDRSGELRRQFLITALERNRNPQLRMRSIQEIAVLREAEPFDTAIDHVGQWPREERREASRTLLQAMADRRIGRRDQATAWIWRLAEYTRDLHEEYAAQRWPATKHLLGLLVNSSGAAHARNARRLVHAARQHDRRLQAALLAAAVAHTPEAEEVLREARTRLARKPGALSRDLLKDFPSGKRRKKRSRNKKKGGENGVAQGTPQDALAEGAEAEGQEGAVATLEAEDTQGQNGQGGSNGQGGNGAGNPPGTGRRSRSRRGRSRGGRRRGGQGGGEGTPVENGEEPTETITLTVPVTGGDPVPADADAPAAGHADTPTGEDADAPPRRRRVRGRKAAEARASAEAEDAEAAAGPGDPSSRDTRSADAPEPATGTAAPGSSADAPQDAARPVRRRRRTGGVDAEAAEAAPTLASAAPPELEAPKPRRTRRTAAQADGPTAGAATAPEPAAASPAPAAATPAAPAAPAAPAETETAAPAKPKRTRKTAAQKAAEAAAAETTTADAPPLADGATTDAPAKPKRAPRKTAAQKAAEAAAADVASAADAAAETPKPKRAPRKTAAQKAAEAATAAADTAPAAVPAQAAATPDSAPAKPKRAPRKTAAQKAAEAAAAAADATRTDAPAATAATPDDAPTKPKRAPRKTAAQKAAEAADADATAAGDAAAETPKPKRASRATAAKSTGTTTTRRRAGTTKKVDEPA